MMVTYLDYEEQQQERIIEEVIEAMANPSLDDLRDLSDFHNARGNRRKTRRRC